MIPKVIHYCWFGGNPLPESAIKCINSWKKFLPDHEIKEWNESNYDVHKIPYIHEAYEAKKYAFVSDYARFDILYHEGGVYFDTDVEVIRSIDDIIERGPFMGIEVEMSDKNSYPLVAPGLGIASCVRLPLYRDILNYYQDLHFLDESGIPVEITVVKHITKVLVEHGMKSVNVLQEVSGIWIYPRDYFNPLNDNTGVLNITDNTRSIHWYTKTWMNKRNPILTWIIKRIHRYFGDNSLALVKKLFIS